MRGKGSGDLPAGDLFVMEADPLVLISVGESPRALAVHQRITGPVRWRKPDGRLVLVSEPAAYLLRILFPEGGWRIRRVSLLGIYVLYEFTPEGGGRRAPNIPMERQVAYARRYGALVRKGGVMGRGFVIAFLNKAEDVWNYLLIAPD